jgi:hypothetical protein
MASLMLNKALYYRSLGFSIIPVGKDKKPLLKWEEFQKRKATEEEIKSWWEKWLDANIGIITGAISNNLGAIDRDTEEGREALEELLPESFITPTTQTPRKGNHFYCLTPKGLELRNNSRIINGCDFRGEGGYIIAPPSVTEDGRYQWLPGLSLDEVPLAPLPQAYIDFVIGQAGTCNNVLNSINAFGIKRGWRQIDDTLLQKGNRDNFIFHIANQLSKSYTDTEEIRLVLEIIAKSCVPPFPEKEIKNKIESALKRVERRERNLAQEIREWVLSSTGVFLSSDIYKCLQLSSREDQKNLSKVLGRLCDEGLIERYGNKNGCFRAIDNATEEMDYLNAPESSLDISWPFEIEKYVKTLPKNVIVIAGTSNAGKTAFLLNLIEMNMDRHEVNYFSSEMSNIELRDRLSKFERPLSSWRFKAIERSINFSDVIKKDGVNIIDYLELHEEFYKIGGYIKDIYDKLDKGIVIIALQKNPGALYGLGGARGIEKARLYLTLDNHIIKIEKAKNWANPQINPNNRVLEFKLHKGCQFEVVRDWNKETPKQ